MHVIAGGTEDPHKALTNYSFRRIGGTASRNHPSRTGHRVRSTNVGYQWHSYPSDLNDRLAEHLLELRQIRNDR